ncbi:MAG: hypothetical protein K0A90_00090 [Methanosarcinaceae archaeon]|nr:hypothetical protein [Methanosarcinaceae archaeon]
MRLQDVKGYILRKIKGAYGLRVGATALLVAGSFLLGEHLYLWGINDTFGHEWVGVGLIILSVGIGYLSTKVN